MKILIYADNHFCQYSSIIRSRGIKYSTRLENQINSINWLESLSKEKNCNIVISLGDFFDSASLNAEEITALRDIKWNNSIKHIFLVGNHEVNTRDISYNTINLLGLANYDIIDRPTSVKDDKYTYCFLPYIYSSERLASLKDYFPDSNTNIVFSHNDIAGIQYGAYKSEDGFNLDDILSNCCLFFNGHLHNMSKLCETGKAYNIGNLTGLNFSEDAFNYPHGVWILDTVSKNLEFIENPFAFNFYKLDFTENINVDFSLLKNNAVLSIKVSESNIEKVQTLLSNYSNKIVESRILVDRNKNSDYNTTVKLEQVNYLEQFNEYMRQQIGNSEMVVEELAEVVK